MRLVASRNKTLPSTLTPTALGVCHWPLRKQKSESGTQSKVMNTW